MKSVTTLLALLLLSLGSCHAGLLPTRAAASIHRGRTSNMNPLQVRGGDNVATILVPEMQQVNQTIPALVYSGSFGLALLVIALVAPKMDLLLLAFLLCVISWSFGWIMANIISKGEKEAEKELTYKDRKQRKKKRPRHRDRKQRKKNHKSRALRVRGGESGMTKPKIIRKEQISAAVIWSVFCFVIALVSEVLQAEPNGESKGPSKSATLQVRDGTLGIAGLQVRGAATKLELSQTEVAVMWIGLGIGIAIPREFLPILVEKVLVRGETVACITLFTIFFFCWVSFGRSSQGTGWMKCRRN